MGSFFGAGKIRCSHILVRDEDTGRKVLNALGSGADFAGQAQRYSTCPSKDRGGDLGKFSKSQMVAEFSQAAFALDVGETSGLVKTKFGYHIIRRTA